MAQYVILEIKLIIFKRFDHSPGYGYSLSLANTVCNVY